MINFTKKNIYSFSSALQKRHVQIHDLRSRLNNTGFKIGELQNINSKKDELIKALEQQLGKEKREVDSMKIELDKVGREKSNVLISRIFLPINISSIYYIFRFHDIFSFFTKGNLNERYDTMAQDKSALERGKDRLQVISNK